MKVPDGWTVKVRPYRGVDYKVMPGGILTSEQADFWEFNINRIGEGTPLWMSTGHRSRDDALTAAIAEIEKIDAGIPKEAEWEILHGEVPPIPEPVAKPEREKRGWFR